MTERLYEQIGAKRRELLTHRQVSGADLQGEWRAYLGGLDLSPINVLIAKHNAYYPIEAGLRMEWPSGSYILPRGAQYPMAPITLESLLAEFGFENTSEL